MPQGMSDDVRDVIVQALARGLSRGQISGVVGVSKRAITRINTNLKKHGTPKAPPTGVKMGRPAKMSDAQAQAMLSWMADRDYTFYIKDLVKYLREEHGFVGCDGTVRRVLVRAGFKRKLPWHKSEITTWLPPQPTSDADQLQLEPDNQAPNPNQVPQQQQQPQPQQQQAQPPSLTTGDIDPALEQHHAQLPQQPPTANMQQHPHTHTPNFQQAYQGSPLQQQHHQAPPMYQLAQQHHSHSQQPNSSFAALPIDPSPSAGGNSSAMASNGSNNNGGGPPAPATLPPKPRRQPRSKTTQLESKVSDLTTQLTAQQELIAQLQQQLATQANAQTQSPQEGQQANDGLNGQQAQPTPYYGQGGNGYP